ncbi:MAG: VOC family protein, partial [Pseudonocardia sp.]|nr:VOC family protein [Pseudonocardia sp.]
MPVLNHHIVAARDPEATARFYIDLLGLDDAVRLGHFVVLKVSDDTTLDFVEVDGDFDRLH